MLKGTLTCVTLAITYPGVHVHQDIYCWGDVCENLSKYPVSLCVESYYFAPRQNLHQRALFQWLQVIRDVSQNTRAAEQLRCRPNQRESEDQSDHSTNNRSFVCNKINESRSTE